MQTSWARETPIDCLNLPSDQEAPSVSPSIRASPATGLRAAVWYVHGPWGLPYHGLGGPWIDHRRQKGSLGTLEVYADQFELSQCPFERDSSVCKDASRPVHRSLTNSTRPASKRLTLLLKVQKEALQHREASKDKAQGIRPTELRTPLLQTLFWEA